MQVIAPVGGFALPVEDLSGAGGGGARGGGAAAGRGGGGAPVRPGARGRSCGRGCCGWAAEEHVLLLSHAPHRQRRVVHGGARSASCAALYGAYREGAESPLPELAVQYADYAVWQREQLEGEVLERQLGYWTERLAGAPELLELPTDRPRPAVQTYRGAQRAGRAPGRAAGAPARRWRGGEGVTLFMVLLAAFQVLLSRYSGQEDVVVGSPIAGRTRRGGGGADRLLRQHAGAADRPVGGPELPGAAGAGAGGDAGGVRSTRTCRSRSWWRSWQPERSLSHSPLFQVMFALQSATGAEAAFPGLRLEGAAAEAESAKFDLTLALAATPQGLVGELNYSTDLFERGTVQRMVGHLERVLEQVARGRGRFASPGWSCWARRSGAQVLEEWNRTDGRVPRGPLPPPAVRGAGGAHAGGGGGGLRGGVADAMGS